MWISNAFNGWSSCSCASYIFIPINIFEQCTEHKAIISELPHSDEFSRIDNTNKAPIIVDLDIDPQTGARLYDLYPHIELHCDNQEFLDELTGRNRFDEENPNNPHPAWTEIINITTSGKHPKGIKGLTKLINKCKCCCMKKMKASICSCTIYEVMTDSLSRYHRYQPIWHHRANEKRKGEISKRK